MRRPLLLPLLAGLTFAAHVSTAHATGVAEADPANKGIVGGALLGAEAVVLVEAAFDVQPAWAYMLGGVAGAAGGGFAGYYLQKSASARVNLIALAGGLALIIPTTIAVANARAYSAPADDLQDRGPADEPVAGPPEASLAPRPVAVAPALVRVGGEVSLGVPAIEFSATHADEELAVFGAQGGTRWTVPVLSWLF
jgi:hypothetical protein